MELLNYIESENIKNFSDLKQVLESENFYLKIKEDEENPGLFLIHTQENSKFENKIVRECNGIIMDKNTLKIVCYSFDKCKEENVFDDELNKNELYIEHSLEGTLVRLYFYNGTWYLATKKCINAAKSKWLSEKNFLELFQETLIKTDKLDIYNQLNPDYCYSFILSHPDNNIVVRYNMPFLFHVGTIQLSTLQEINNYIGITKPERKPVSVNEIENSLTMIKNDSSNMYEGFIFIDTNFRRQKFKTNFYNYLRQLWGNTNNRFFRYLELRKNLDTLNEYLNYFESDRNIFIEYEKDISYLAKDVLAHYISKYVEKGNVKNPYYLGKFLYKIHGDYMKTRVQTNMNKILLELYDLDPKKLCFIYNHHKKMRNITEEQNDAFMEEIDAE